MGEEHKDRDTNVKMTSLLQLPLLKSLANILSSSYLMHTDILQILTFKTFSTSHQELTLHKL